MRVWVIWLWKLQGSELCNVETGSIEMYGVWSYVVKEEREKVKNGMSAGSLQWEELWVKARIAMDTMRCYKYDV